MSAQRARLHLKIGEVLEDLYSHADEYVSRIAHHFFEAAMVGGMKRAIIFCRRAAELAALRGQLKDAANLYEMAISALEFQRVDDPSDRRELNRRLRSWGRESSAMKISNRMSSRKVRCSQGPLIRPERRARAKRRLRRVPRDRVPCRASPASPPDTVISDDAAKRGEKNPSVFRREGEFRTLVFEGQVMRLKHSNGLLFVAHLLQHPDRDFHVAQLVALLPSARNHHADGVYLSRSEKERLGIHDLGGREFIPLLDATTKAEYRRRIDECVTPWNRRRTSTMRRELRSWKMSSGSSGWN